MKSSLWSQCGKSEEVCSGPGWRLDGSREGISAGAQGWADMAGTQNWGEIRHGSGGKGQ